MGTKDKALPLFEVMVVEYKDRIVGQCKCNKCGGQFGVTLRANPAAIESLPEAFKVKRLLTIADRQHSCPDDSLPVDDAETDRIVNVYHETKRRLVDKGLMNKYGLPTTSRTRGRKIE